MTLVKRCAEAREAVEVGEAEWHQRGGPAVLPDLVVELFEAALRACHRDDVRALLCKRACGRIADAARGAGDKDDAIGEGERHHVNTFVMPGPKARSASSQTLRGIHVNIPRQSRGL